MGAKAPREEDLSPRELAELRAQRIEDSRKVEAFRAEQLVKEQQKTEALKPLNLLGTPATIIEVIKEIEDLKKAFNRLVALHVDQG